MNVPNAQPSQLHDSGDAEAARYQAISIQAVLGLALGLCASVALAEPALWPLPAAGIGASALALWRIARSDSGLSGRRMALTGLWLSLAFFAGARAEHWTYQWHVHREARQVAQSWFEFLRHDCPLAAFALTDVPERRWPRDGLTLAQWEAEVRGDSTRAESLKQFMAQPAVGKLLALGEKAHADCLLVEDVEENVVRTVFAVSRDDAQRKDAVILLLLRERHQAADQSSWRLGHADWRLLNVQSNYPTFNPAR